MKPQPLFDNAQAREDVEHIMDSFTVLKACEEAQHGTFRTKEAILEVYDTLDLSRLSEYRSRAPGGEPAGGWKPNLKLQDGDA